MKEIVVKVSMNCELCKTGVLKAVTKLEGINEIKVDGEKETITVIGEVDPVDIVNQLKKIKKTPKIQSVGPPKKKPDEPEDPTPVPICFPPPYCYNPCELVAVREYDDPKICSIM